MVCRTTPGGRVLTNYVRSAFHWHDSQCTSLYHQLRREATEQGLSVPTSLYHAELREIRSNVLASQDLSSAVRDRSLMRIDAALASQGDGTADVYAAFSMRQHVLYAEQYFERERWVAARQSGASVDFVTGEFRRLVSNPPEGASSLPNSPFGVPNDSGTRWALHVLGQAHRCETCGQFIDTSGMQVHACASTLAGPSASTSAAPRVAASAPDVDALDMDTFQEEYDRAKEAIRGGQRDVPTFEDWEQTPGLVTGGLGAPSGGTTFGLEIELDFPNDEYPYDARQTLARDLFHRRLALSPGVTRWHFLGGEGEERPGGEYELTSGGWSCEFDRTVDDVEGERGVEVKSQILLDTPETWRNVRAICEAARRYGAEATTRTGVHVNVGGDMYPDSDPSTHLRLIRLFASFDDTLIRLAHNPAIGPQHRGRRYCAPVRPVRLGENDYLDVVQVKNYAGHYHAVNLGHLPDEFSERTDSSRIEVRIFDSSTDVGRLQAQTVLSLALVRAAAMGEEAGFDERPSGFTRSRFGSGALSGADWEEATYPFRRLMAILRKCGADDPRHMQQMFHLFAESRWPQSGR